MLIVKILLLLLILQIAYAGFRVRYLISTKSIPLVAASHVYEQNRTTGGFPKILVFGDSNGVGTGVLDPNESVAGHFGADFPKAEIENRSINGLKVKGLNDLFSPEANSYDFILLQIGANDVLRFTSLDDIRKDMNEILKKATKASPRVVWLSSGNVGLAPFFARSVGWAWSIRSKMARDLFLELAKQHGVVYVDLYAERSDDLFAQDPDRYYAGDKLHLSKDGYSVWYLKIRAAMQKAGVVIPAASER